MRLINQERLLGDFLGTLPFMQAVATREPLEVIIHPEAAQLAALSHPKYGIRFIKTTDVPDDMSLLINTLDLQHAFRLSVEHMLYMSQAHFLQQGWTVPAEPPKADLLIPDIPVPKYDFIVAPFSKSLPEEQKWPQEQWQNLVNMFPDLTFCVIGSHKDPRGFVHGQNVFEHYGLLLNRVFNLLKNARNGIISVVSGPSHMAFHTGVQNILLTNQNMEWGNNPDAFCIKDYIPTLKAETVARKIKSFTH